MTVKCSANSIINQHQRSSETAKTAVRQYEKNEEEQRRRGANYQSGRQMAGDNTHTHTKNTGREQVEDSRKKKENND